MNRKVLAFLPFVLAYVFAVIGIWTKSGDPSAAWLLTALVTFGLGYITALFFLI